MVRYGLHRHLDGGALKEAMTMLFLLISIVVIAAMMAVLPNKTAPGEVTEQRGYFVFNFDEGDGAGVIASCANPEGEALYITDVILIIDEVSTVASTLDVGIAANAATGADNLIDGLSGATAGTFSNRVNAGTNGLLGKTWAASEFLTVSEASGNVVGIEGRLLIKYARVGL